MASRSPEQVVRPPRWRAVLPAGVSLALAAAVTYIVVSNPYTTSITGPCMLLHTTGLFCPGCGGTRAVYELATGDLLGAMSMNVFVTLLVIPPMVLGLAWWLLYTLGVAVPRFNIRLPAVLTYLGLLTVFAVVRNIPYFEPWLSPV